MLRMSGEKKNKFRTPSAEMPPLEPEQVVHPIEEPVAKKSTEKRNKNRAAKEEKRTEIDSSEKASIMQRLGNALAILKDERFVKISGLILMVTGAYLLVALVSYFFTYQVDQDKVLAGSSQLFAPEIKVTNWLGKFGAIVSHWFMYRAFGASSFLIVPTLIIYGLQRLTGRTFVNTAVFNARLIFLMVWTSMVFSLFFADTVWFMGGGFGYHINAWLLNYVGTTGLVVLLAFTMLSALVISFNINFKWPEKRAEMAMEEELVEEPISNNDLQKNSTAPLHAYSEPVEPTLTPEEEAALLNFEIKTLPANDTTEPVEMTVETVEPTSEEQSVQEEPVQDLDFEVIQRIEEEINAENKVELSAVVVEEPKKSGDPDFEITTVEEPEVLQEENKAATLVEQFGEYDPTLDLGSYQFPNFDLLQDYGSSQGKVSQDELIANKNRILSTLKNYGIEIDKISATVGPTVTLYEIVPAAGVRISKIKNLEDDIALSLAALGIRIIAPIPGKGTIGIEVPNQTPEMVPMRNIMSSEKFNNSQFELPIALGKTISNEIFIADLAKMPHLLMAGATGQGKSVGLNAILVSLLYKKHPSQVKFVLVDPKKVELTLFNKIERHFLAKLPNSEDAIITDNTKVIHTLNSLCIEMDNRYALLQDAQVRNIKEYNAKFVQRKLNPNDGHKFLPYIVLVVDEFADLIMTAGKEVETPIARLAQLARAIGIHLIIATQRPSVNIITGTIKANFPARIAFRVTSKIDSRTILDSGGADQLIGRGDMLLSTGNDLIRIQCAFVDTPEVEKITEFIGNQRAYPSAFLLPEYVGEEGDSGKEDVDLSERDKMFDEAAKLIVQFQQGSASFLQRKLKLGYNRAGRIVDQMEAAGVIGPFEGSKAREVLIKDMGQLDEILQRLKSK